MVALSFVRGRRLYRLMSFSCAMAFALYGYDAGVLGGIQQEEPFLSAMGHPTGAYVIPMIASSYTLAACVCALAISFIGLPLGRKNCILMGNGFVIIGAAVQASSFSVGQIIAGRVLCGFGVGFISSTVPSYMSEMSITEKERGPELAVQCAVLISGVALAYWIDLGFAQLNSQASWRFPIAFQSFFSLVSAAAMLCLPDTPRWYYAKGRYQEGDEVICRLHDQPLDHPDVQKMHDAIVRSITLEDSEENKFNFKHLFWDKTPLRAGRRLRIAFLILSCQQLMGINLSVYYSTKIFSQVGLSSFLSQVLAAVMNMIFSIGTYFTIPTIERFGRRPILFWSAFMLLLCMIVFVVLQGLPNPTIGRQWGSVAALMVYNFFFGYGWMGPAWLYGPEVAPLKQRHIAGSIGAFGEWLFTFLVVFAGGVALNTVGWKIWLWMLLSCVATLAFVYFMCPEMTGKSLEEIDVLFATEEVKAQLAMQHSNEVSDDASDQEKDKEGVLMVEHAETREGSMV